MFFFFNDTATTEIYTLSLHDALPILDPFNLVIPEEGLEWNAVIGWRIATYYVPIVVTWILLVKLALGKYTRPETAQNECPVCGKLLSDTEFASHLEKNHPSE